MGLNDMLVRIARGGSNRGTGRRRRSNRPRGEGRGFIDSVLALFRRS
jgi:hypothetical protein